jgi:2-iminobutanoate/2-iminopropanoate deaminase
MAATGQGRASARVNVAGRGETNVGTGLPVLDHLLVLMATYASFDLALEVEPAGGPEVEIAAAARSLGEALSDPLRAEGARGHGSAVVPVDEALAHVALEASGRPLLVSNVDLSEARVAGQVSLVPGASDISGITIQEQTEQVMKNLGAILDAAGSGLDRLVKTTVFLQSLADFPGMNEVYSKHVGDQPPARSTFEVAKLPNGALVEIEAIALA